MYQYQPPLCAHISPITEIGVRTGAAFSISALSRLTGLPIGGAILTHSHGRFQNTIVFGRVSCAVGTGLFLVTRAAVLGGEKI